MHLDIKGSFYRDWKEISNRELSKLLREKIDEIESAHGISKISHLKKLRKFSSRYRIEISVGKKVYWILCIVWENKIEFVRLKSETYFKREL